MFLLDLDFTIIKLNSADITSVRLLFYKIQRREHTACLPAMRKTILCLPPSRKLSYNRENTMIVLC